jgi:hypothetical protein
MSDELTWADYYDENEDREPRELLLEALSRFGPGSHDAVDLGVRLRHRHPRDPRTRLAGVRHRCRARGHPPAAVSGPGRADARAPNDGGSDGAGRAPGGRPDLGRVQPLLLPPAAMVGGLAEGTRRGPSRWPVRRPDPGRTGHLGAPTERSRRSHANRPEPCSTASRSNASRRRRRTARRARVRSTGTSSTCLPAGPRDRVRTAGRGSAHRLVTLDARPSGLPTWARPSRVTEVDR